MSDADSVGRRHLSSELRRALEAAFSDHRVRGVERPGGSGHPGNEVVRVRLAGEPTEAYLKVATADDWGRERVARETAVLRAIADRAPVRVPSVLAADPDADPPFVATRPLPGRRLVDRLAESVDGDAFAAVLRSVGATMAGLHAVRLDDVGVITGADDTGLALADDPWPAVLRRTKVEAPPTPERFADLPDRVGTLFEEHVPDLRVDRPTLVHDDLHAQNVFADPLGAIDFESSMAGDPAFDLVRTEDVAVDGRPDLDADTRERGRTALLEGYREGARRFNTPTGSDDLPPGFRRRRPAYRAVTFLMTVLTFEHWAVETPETTDALADWVRSEFDRRLDAARATPDP